MAKSILNLHREKTALISGEIIFKNKNLLELNDKELGEIRGKNISYIFQDPNTHLNPLLSIGYQINETIIKHRILNRKLSKEFPTPHFGASLLKSFLDNFLKIF